MTIETQEERIERLTRLARKVWPNDQIEVLEDEMGYSVEDSGVILFVQVIHHPRALDALEAALAVLAVEPLPPIEAGTERELREAAPLPEGVKRVDVSDVLPADDELDENAAPTVRYDSNRPGPA